MPRAQKHRLGPLSGGLSIKKGLTVINAPGTIDSDYRGEIKVMINLSNELQTIDTVNASLRLYFRHETVSLLEVDDISPTERGCWRFGSTGGK